MSVDETSEQARSACGRFAFCDVLTFADELVRRRESLTSALGSEMGASGGTSVSMVRRYERRSNGHGSMATLVPPNAGEMTRKYPAAKQTLTVTSAPDNPIWAAV
ncbi:MAG TPA: hypothetical protein VI854_01390 [Acidimicrobiia bacterium]|nr:hypothetical protein [Acidimicrobiia bacterium]